jgi:hypothetical protein
MVSQAKRPDRDALTTIYYHILSCVLKNLTDIILIQMVIKKSSLPTLPHPLPTLPHPLPTLPCPPYYPFFLEPNLWMMYFGAFGFSPSFS